MLTLLGSSLTIWLCASRIAEEDKTVTVKLETVMTAPAVSVYHLLADMTKRVHWEPLFKSAEYVESVDKDNDVVGTLALLCAACTPPSPTCDVRHGGV